MSTRLIVPLVFALPFGIAVAQDAPPTPSRAQRDAENPLRLIIEASKIKPRARAVAEVERAARVPERVQVRARVAAPADPALAPAPAPIAEPAAVVAAPMPRPAEAPPAAPLRTGPESQVREVVVPTPPVEPAPALPVAETAAPSAAPLQVATMVEPSVPRRLLDKVRGDVEVVVTFTVNPDGSVGNAAVQSSTNRLMNATVLEAVAQWRYAPIPAAREHAVQLVLRQD